MKLKLIIIFILLITGYSAFPQSGKMQTQVIYTCPMHPQIQESKPGDCPICGMKLEKKTVKAPSQHNHTDVHHHTEPTDNAQKEHPHIDTSAANAEKSTMNTTPANVAIATTSRRVRYDLYIGDSLVSYDGTGKMRRAITVNGMLPAPTLEFNEGDTAEIWVHNTLKEATMVHWHGLILPNQHDGVPYLTTAPIKPGASHLFTFPLIQNGTYWYHSHAGSQEQDGLYGALIIHKREEPAYKQLAVVLSDWTNMKSKEVDRSLHMATDWFAIKKNSMQSYAEAINEGAFKVKVVNEWKRMLAMDVSDVYYERFLINGMYDGEYPDFKPGEKVRLRIVNGSASTYFWLTWAGGKITVIANDGEDVEPVDVDRMLIAVAETYDIIVTIPDDKHSYEFLATPEDRTKSTSIWLGTGPKVIAPHLPRLKYFAGMEMMNNMMKMNGNLTGMEDMTMTNQVMDMNTVMYPEITGGSDMKYGNAVYGAQSDSDTATRTITNNYGGTIGKYIGGKWEDMNSGSSGIKTLNYTMLKATRKTTLPDAPTRVLHFELTGNMNRYVWTINNKTVSEADTIQIKKGTNVRIILFNNTMMRHPMHLHGHFFRVLNGQGEYSPLKNTLDIMPMETDTIEFAATESGDWFFHCHILYHMMSGMGRVFSYESSPANPEISDPKYVRRMLYREDRMFHFMTNIGLETNGSDGEAMVANTRWKLETMWHLGTHAEHGYESETMLGRYLGKMQWWYPYIGFDYHHKDMKYVMNNGHEGGNRNIFGSEEYNMFGQKSNKPNRQTVVAGIRYTLPMLLEADMRIDGNGKIRFQLGREDIPVAKRLRLNIMLNTDKEYMAGFRYILTKYISLSSHYDSDMGLGAGITLTY